MQYKPSVAVVSAALLAVFLVSCAGNEQKEIEVIEVPETVEPVVVGPIEPEPEVVVPEPEPAPTFSERDALLQVDTFYFDYDASALPSASNDALDVHAEEIISKLGTNPNAVITIEGHTDERGTIEYNNALGARRAEAVASYLELKGVPRENIETISYGELRPVAEGSDETSWALNRRSVIDY